MLSRRHLVQQGRTTSDVLGPQSEDGNRLMLHVSGVEVQRSQKTILSDVSFRCGTPELIGVIGHNGAGKTTLMRSIVGLQKMTAGEVVIQGQRRAGERRKHVSYLPQGGLPFPDATVAKVIGSLAQRHNAALAGPLDELVRDAAGRRLAALSGGERRLVGVWLALASDAPVVVLDEPSNDLDPQKRAQMWTALHTHVANGRIVLVVTHNLHELDHQASRILLLRGGALMFDGSVGEFARRVGGSRVSMPAAVARSLEIEGSESGRPHDSAASERAAVVLTVEPSSLPVLLARVQATDPAALADVTVSQPSLVDAYERFECG